MNLKPPSIAVSRNTSGYRLGRGARHEFHRRKATSPPRNRYSGGDGIVEQTNLSPLE
jgi:hypothetical protein